MAFTTRKDNNIATILKVTFGVCGSVLFILWVVFYSGLLQESSNRASLHQLKSGDVVDEDSFQIEVLHESRPRILYAKNFLSHKECDKIIELVAESLRRSTVASAKQAGGNSRVDDVRTSSGAWLNRNSHEAAVKKFVSRVSQWTSLPKDHGEDVQVLRYEAGQQYKPHVDYFDPVIYPQHLEHGGQRIASVLCFLNDVEKGGETIFPTPGISVKPEKGSAVLWFNAFLNGTLDSTSLHGGSPVGEGSLKYVAVQWMRQSKR